MLLPPRRCTASGFAGHCSAAWCGSRVRRLCLHCRALMRMCQPLNWSRRVDGGIPLREALAQHEAWLREQSILGKVGA